MATAMIMDWPVTDRSTARYDALTQRMGVQEDPPPGLLFHGAGFVDDTTWRIFDVWERPEDHERFLRERLMPAVAGLPAGGSPPLVTVAYELHSHQAR